jgi:hypothetical protein
MAMKRTDTVTGPMRSATRVPEAGTGATAIGKFVTLFSLHKQLALASALREPAPAPEVILNLHK